MERLISPDTLNRITKAGEEITEFINLLKEDCTTYDHLTMDYMKYFKEDIANEVIDIREIGYGIKDVELPSGIFTICFVRSIEEVGESRYYIVNDMALSRSAEIETESGYMDMLNVTKTIHDTFVITFN